MTAEPSIGELIRAGDWDAINAYQKNKRKAQSGFLGTTETNQDRITSYNVCYTKLLRA